MLMLILIIIFLPSKAQSYKCQCYKFDKWVYIYFLESKVAGVNRLSALIHSDTIQKCVIVNYNVIISGENFYDQPTNSDIKWYRETRKVTTGQGEVYLTGCLLDNHSFKIYYKLITVDLSWQKELDTVLEAVQQENRIGWIIRKFR